MSISPNGWDMNMGKKMVIGLVGQFVSAAIVIMLTRIMLGNSRDAGFAECVKFISLTGLAIGFISHFQYWNWFEFSTPYVAVIVIDTVIAWFLAGLVMTKFIPAEKGPSPG